MSAEPKPMAWNTAKFGLSLETTTGKSIWNVSTADDGMDTVVPTLSVEQAATYYMTYKLGLWIEWAYFPSIVFLGTIGNLLSFLVMMSRSNRKISCSWYMAILALTDTMLLITYLSVWLKVVFLNSLYEMSCRITTIFFNWSSNSSISIIIGLTFDRYLAICFPFKFKNVRTPKYAKRVIIGLLTFCLLMNIPHIFTSRRMSPKTCASFASKSPYTKIYYFIHMTIFSIIPYIMIFTMNISIIRTMATRTKYFDKMNGEANDSPAVDKYENSGINSIKLQSTAGQARDTVRRSSGIPKSHNLERQLTIMLLAVSFAFLFLTLPLFIRYFLYTSINPRTSAKAYALYHFLYNLSNKLYMTNNAVNFYLYAITGSKFRKDLMELFGCSKSCKSTNVSSSLTSQDTANTQP